MNIDELKIAVEKCELVYQAARRNTNQAREQFERAALLEKKAAFDLENARRCLRLNRVA